MKKISFQINIKEISSYRIHQMFINVFNCLEIISHDGGMATYGNKHVSWK